MQARSRDWNMQAKAIAYIKENGWHTDLKKTSSDYIDSISHLQDERAVQMAVRKFDSELLQVQKKYIPKQLNKHIITAPIESMIFACLSDTDLAHLTINKMMARRILADIRFKKRLLDPVRRSIQERRMLHAYCEGTSLNKKLIQKNIEAETELVFQSLKEQGITNYQTLYACYKKLRTFSIWTLNEDQIILLSGNEEVINRWFVTNHLRIERNEPLDHFGLRAYHYLALSGNAQAMHAYRKLGFDPNVKDWEGENYLKYACFSGNPATVSEAKEFKKNIPKSPANKAFSYPLVRNDGYMQYAELSGDLRIINLIMEADMHSSFLHVVKSGNLETIKILQEQIVMHDPPLWEIALVETIAETGCLQTLRSAIDELKLQCPKTLAHSAIRNKAVLKFCVEEKKYDPKLKNARDESLLHSAAIYGELEPLRMCVNDYKLDIREANASGEMIQHFSAQSGNTDSLLYCALELKLDLKSMDQNNHTIVHFAARSSNPAQLFLCHLLDMPTKGISATKEAVCFSKLSTLLACQLLEMPFNTSYILNNNQLFVNLLELYPLDFCLPGHKLWEPHLSLADQAIHTVNDFLRKQPKNSAQFYATDKHMKHYYIAKKCIKHLEDFRAKPHYDLFFFLNYFLMDLIEDRQVETKDRLTAYLRFAANQTLRCILEQRQAKLQSKSNVTEPCEPTSKKQRLT